MSGRFARQIHTTRWTEVRPLLVGVPILLLASALWYAVRPHLIAELARSSFGSAVRAQLIATAIRDGFPDRPFVEVSGYPNLVSFANPAPGSVVWISDVERQTFPNGLTAYKNFRRSFADGNFDYLGSIRSEYFAYNPAADWDDDGGVEVMVPYSTGERPATAPAVGCWAIIRLGEDENKIVGLIEVVSNARQIGLTLGWFATSPQAVWRDEEGDGMEELSIVSMHLRQLPNGSFASKRAPPIATFEWTAPGGVLRPRSLPEGNLVLFWPPPGERPYVYPADAQIDPICRRLLPLPDGFGAAPTSQPATQPKSQTVKP